MSHTEPPGIPTLVEQWRESDTHRRRAQLEDALWKLAPDSERTPASRRATWLHKLLGCSTYEAQNRYYLHTAGKGFDALWARVEPPEEMPLATAVDRMREARRMQGEDSAMTLDVALATVLKEYDSWPMQRGTNGGKPFRKKPQSYISRSKPPPENVVHLDETERGAWLSIRHAIGNLAKIKLRGQEKVFADEMLKELEQELKSVLDVWQSKLNRAAARRRKDVVTIRYSAVVEACESLCMDPPEKGEVPDMVLAKKQRRNLVRVYHPDRAGTSNVEKYREVLQAYGVLEDYSAAMSKSIKENA